MKLLENVFVDYKDTNPSWIRFVKHAFGYSTATVIILYRYLNYLYTHNIGGGNFLYIQ